MATDATPCRLRRRYQQKTRYSHEKRGLIIEPRRHIYIVDVPANAPAGEIESKLSGRLECDYYLGTMCSESGKHLGGLQAPKPPNGRRRQRGFHRTELNDAGEANPHGLGREGDSTQ